MEMFKSSSLCRHNAVLTHSINRWGPVIICCRCCCSSFLRKYIQHAFWHVDFDLLSRWLENKSKWIFFPLDGAAEIGDVHPVERKRTHLNKGKSKWAMLKMLWQWLITIPIQLGIVNRPQYKATHPGFWTLLKLEMGFVFSIFFNSKKQLRHQSSESPAISG